MIATPLPLHGTSSSSEMTLHTPYSPTEPSTSYPHAQQHLPQQQQRHHHQQAQDLARPQSQPLSQAHTPVMASDANARPQINRSLSHHHAHSHAHIRHISQMHHVPHPHAHTRHRVRETNSAAATVAEAASGLYGGFAPPFDSASIIVPAAPTSPAQAGLQRRTEEIIQFSARAMGTGSGSGNGASVGLPS